MKTRGRKRAGLPIGLEVISPYLEDRTPLRFAAFVGHTFRGLCPPPGVWGSVGTVSATSACQGAAITSVRCGQPFAERFPLRLWRSLRPGDASQGVRIA